MAKRLSMTFAAEDGSKMTLSIADPKTDLDEAAVTAAGAKIAPVLANSEGVAMKELVGAKYVTTTEEVLLG